MITEWQDTIFNSFGPFPALEHLLPQSQEKHIEKDRERNAEVDTWTREVAALGRGGRLGHTPSGGGCNPGVEGATPPPIKIFQRGETERIFWVENKKKAGRHEPTDRVVQDKNDDIHEWQDTIFNSFGPFPGLRTFAASVAGKTYREKIEKEMQSRHVDPEKLLH